jgi:membrane protease YdiL (CAAX protease family)
MQDQSANVNGGTTSAPWGGMEMLAALYLVWFVWPITVSLVLKSLGVEHWYYEDTAPEMPLRLGLWVRTFSFPFQVLTIPLLLSAFSGTRLDQLGLTTWHFGRNVLAGVAGWLLLTPVAFGIFALLRYLSPQTGEHKLEEHLLETIGRQRLFPSEWAMLIVTAMVSAPFLEELTFRGVLQPWLAARRWGGHAAMLGAILLAISFRWQHLREAWPVGFPALVRAATPLLFVLSVSPIYLLVCCRSRTSLAPALFGTSLLFAYIHASVWPSPIPLFVLSLGLGYVAYRSGSLVGPIVLHGLFNGVSCVQLLLGW